MPIRLNLLAEAQAAEDLRRRDPVKHAIWLAGLLVALMLVWSSGLYLKAMIARRALGRVEGQITVRTNDFQQVLDFRNKTGDIETKLAALVQLATNRFLNGTLLNALLHHAPATAGPPLPQPGCTLRAPGPSSASMSRRRWRPRPLRRHWRRSAGLQIMTATC